MIKIFIYRCVMAWFILMPLFIMYILHVDNIGANTKDIRMTSQIKSPNNYSNQLTMIATAQEGTTIRIHLRGPGGEMNTVRAFASVIQISKAHVITIIEGDVSSGHALLALLGDEIVIGDYNVLMFHIPQLTLDNGKQISVKDYCASLEGFDRGIKLSKKCVNLFKSRGKSTNILFHNLLDPILTKQEYNDMNAGINIYLSGKELKKRLNNNNRGVEK